MRRSTALRFRSTKSEQLATSKNYMEKRCLIKTLSQYRKEYGQDMKQLNNKEHSFLSANYHYIVAMQCLQLNNIFEENQEKMNDKVSHKNERRKQYYHWQSFNTKLSKIPPQTFTHLPNKTYRMKHQRSRTKLPSINAKKIQENNNTETNKYVNTKLPPFDELRLFSKTAR